MEIEDLIINLLRETRVDVKDIKDDISEIKVEVALNRQDLELHMEQTRAVKELAINIKDDANKRISLIENKLTVGYLFKLIITVASGIGIVSGAIYGVIRLL